MLVVGCAAARKLIPTYNRHGDRWERCNNEEAKAAMAQAQRILRRDGDRQPAVGLLRRVVELCPENVPAHVLYQDQALKSGGDAEQSMRNYYAGLKDGGKSPLVPFLNARLAPHEVECKKLLDEATRRDTYFGYAYIEMAEMRRSVDQPDQALIAVQRALEVRGDLMPAQKLAAELYLELGYPARSASHYGVYLKKRPGDERAKRAYSWILVNQLNRADEARPMVQQLLKTNPDDIDLLLELAAIQWRLGGLDEAVATYQHVLRLKPRAALAALNLGDLYYDWKARQNRGANKQDAWRRARLAYRYYLSIEDDSRALLILNRVAGVPYRLRQIEKLLGPATGEVRVEDIAPPKKAIRVKGEAATATRR